MTLDEFWDEVEDIYNKYDLSLAEDASITFFIDDMEALFAEWEEGKSN